MDENKVIFSSEFESEGLKKGVDKGVSHLHELKAEIEDIKNETKAYNKEVTENNKNLEKLGIELAKVQGNQKAYNQLLEKTTPLIAQLGKRNQELTAKIVDNRLETDKLSKTYREAVQHHDVLGKAMSKFGNINHIVAEEVTNVNRRIGHFALDLAVGFGGALLGVAIPTIAKFADGLVEMALKGTEAEESLQKTRKEIAAIKDEAAKDSSKDISTLQILYAATQDLNLSQRERVAAAKALQDTYPETFKNFTIEQILLGKAKAAYDALTKSIYQQSLARAGKKKLDDIAEEEINAQTKFVEKRTQLEEDIDKVIINKTDAQIMKENSLSNKAQLEQFKQNAKMLAQARREQRFELVKEYDEESKLRDKRKKDIIDFVGAENLVDVVTTDNTKKPKKEKAAKTPVEDDFEKRKADFVEQISKLAASEFESELTIRKEYADKLQKALLEIKRDKTITGSEREQLQDLAFELNEKQLTIALDNLHKKRVEAERKINNEIEALQLEHGTNSLKNIKNQFDKEIALIEQQTKKTTAALNNALQTQLAAIEKDRAKGFISEEVAIGKSLIIKDLFGDLTQDALDKEIRDKGEAAFNAYERLVKDMTDTFDDALLSENQNTTKKIVEAAKLYMKGAISFEEFEKRKTKAVRDGVHERNLLLIEETKVRIQAITDELNALTKADPSDPNIKKVKAQQTAAKNALAGLERADAEGQAGDKNKDDDDKIKKIVAYTQAIGSLANEVIGFWAKVNEAEQRQIERSIALQEKRVTAAQRIAERGNAEYLRQEEDRLTALQIKQENAAKKQLAINAVLQASQALVAFVTAMAKGAEIGGPLGAIASAAAVIGLLASGYAIVKSLQEQSPKLFKGSKEVKRTRGEPAGRDTINAWINEGEAVIPTDTNKEYKPTVEAVYDKTVPATVLNTFVKNYSNNKQETIAPTSVLNNFVNSYPKTSIPVVNYNRIGESAEMRINSDGKLVAILQEQKQEMRETREILESVDNSLKDFGVHMGMDRDGIVLAITSAISRKKISSKA